MPRLSALAVLLLALPASRASQHDRRILNPADSVGQQMKQLHANGNAQARFTIHSEISPGQELALDVIEAVNPAVTSETIIKDNNGYESKVDGSSLYTLLVSDTSTADGADTFALLALNPLTDELHGIVEKKGYNGNGKGNSAYKINQSKDVNGGKATAVEETNTEAPAWSCAVDGHFESEDDARKLYDGDEQGHDHEVSARSMSRCIILKLS